MSSFHASRRGVIAAQAGFSPAQIAGLGAWGKSNAITGLVDGDPVGTWVDSSGNGRDATQATAAAKPTYKTGILNGLPAVRCDGVDDSLMVDAASAFVAGSELTIFVLAVRRAVVAEAGIFSAFREGATSDSAETASVLMGYEASTGTQQTMYRNGSARASFASHPGNDVPFVLIARFDGTSSYLRRAVSGSSVDATPVGSTGAFSIDRLQLGRRWTSGAPGTPARYDYVEWGVYNTFVTGADLTALQNYLTARAGF